MKPLGPSEVGNIHARYCLFLLPTGVAGKVLSPGNKVTVYLMDALREGDLSKTCRLVVEIENIHDGERFVR